MPLWYQLCHHTDKEHCVARDFTVEPLWGAVALSHFFLGQCLQPGDVAVDATCGNGKDTLFLAACVVPGGKVYSVDIDCRALKETEQLLVSTTLSSYVELLNAGHEQLADLVTEPVKAVVFNLGYLPGAEDSFTTHKDTTIKALDAALALLCPGGIITVCLYTGHEGGSEEAGAVEEWAASLAPKEFNVWRSRQLNRPPTAPYLIVVEKGGKSG
jgi:hypothetical protein